MSPEKRIKKLQAELTVTKAALAALQATDAPEDDLIRIVVQISQSGEGGQSAQILRPEELGGNPAVALAEAIKIVAYDAAMGFAGGGKQ